MLARTGIRREDAAPARATDERIAVAMLGFSLVYFWFMTVLLLSYSGSLQDIFKIVSPFVFFAMMVVVVDSWLSISMIAASLLVVFGNFALLPTSFGWVDWGDAHTFRGFYFFKADLAYSLSFAILALGYVNRFRLSAFLLLVIAFAAIEVILSNSRLNYLTFGIVLVFVSIKGGSGVARFARFGLMGLIFAATFYFLFDSTKSLGFDTHDSHAFTQGRDTIWEVLVDSGLAKFSPIEWLFGQGLFADILIYSRGHTSGDIHGAHNELLHLLITQGISGLAIYVFLWGAVVRHTVRNAGSSADRQTIAVAVLVLVLQSLTASVGLYAQKTWPVMLILLLVRSSSYGGLERPASVVDPILSSRYGRVIPYR